MEEMEEMNEKCHILFNTVAYMNKIGYICI